MASDCKGHPQTWRLTLELLLPPAAPEIWQGGLEDSAGRARSTPALTQRGQKAPLETLRFRESVSQLHGTRALSPPSKVPKPRQVLGQSLRRGAAPGERNQPKGSIPTLRTGTRCHAHGQGNGTDLQPPTAPRAWSAAPSSPWLCSPALPRRCVCFPQLPGGTGNSPFCGRATSKTKRPVTHYGSKIPLSVSGSPSSL